MRKKQRARTAFCVIMAFVFGFAAGAVLTLAWSRNYTIVISEPDANEMLGSLDEHNTDIEPDETNEPEVQVSDEHKKIVAIDAGHQKKGNFEKEPIAPGAKETKAKVAAGTSGVVTDTPEYQVTLEVSLLLEKELESRGYEVVMIRRSHDVDISNSERAKMAGDAEADAFIRIHCNGAESSSAKGAIALCQTEKNPYCGELYEQSRFLSECVIEGLCEQSGAKNLGVSETDNMSGINWSTVPVTIVELGFMTNPEEDKLLCDSSYQEKLARGIADGVDKYFD